MPQIQRAIVRARKSIEIVTATFGYSASAVALLLGLALSTSARPATAEVAVTIRIRTTDGKPVERAYVALVPLWRPWSRPLVEVIAERGVSVLRVPVGKYQLLAGARGFAVSSKGPVDISQTSDTTIAIALPALKSVTGIVRNRDGSPLTGVRVASVHAAIAAPLGRLSEVAIRHLASDWRATTDEHGKWTLKVPEGAVPLLFEAPGRAAEWRIHSESDSTALDVSLSRGAILTVTTDRIDPKLIVTVAREDAGASNGILANEQSRVLARWTTTAIVQWTSLPPGTYGVYAKYPEPRYFMQTAAKLATVTLAAGDERALRVSLPPVREAAVNVAALFVRGIARSDLAEELEVFGRNATGAPQRMEHFVEEASGGSVVYGKIDAAHPPYYARTSDRFFSPVPDHAEGLLGPNAEPWPTAVLPRADAHFRLRFAEGDLQVPQSGIAVLRECGKVDRVTVPIEISRDNNGEFTAVAGCRSMVLAFDPFEPVISSVVLLAGEQSLGEFVLRGAGSAGVHVVRDPGGALVAGATVQAFNGEASGEASTVVTEAVTDAGGWAHLSGLPSYWKLLVIATTPEGEKSETAVLLVHPRERGLVDPLAVPEPAALVVGAKMDETFLARFPAARVVTLFVRPADPDRQSEQRQEDASKTSPVRFDRLRPGRWLVSGVVSVADTYTPIEIEDVVLKAGEERRIEATMTPNVFEGTVTSEGKGVAAKVMIEDRGRTIYFHSDPNGVFRATLQERGMYRVAVARLSAQGNVIPIGRVSFADPSRRLEIAIPTGGSVTTRVRRGEKPVPGTVWLSRRDDIGLVEQMTNRARTTDVAGEATFDDLAPGPWTFSVRENEGRRGAEKTITVEDGKNYTINLDLTGSVSIEGTVRDLGGSPLSRASIECLFVGPGGDPERAGAIADAEGTFVIELIPPSPPTALCSVIGPMGAVEAFRSIPGRPNAITLPGATATLHISDWPERQSSEMIWLVAQDGRAISLDAVAMKIGRFGSPLSMALASGFWKVVRVASMPQWRSLANGMGMSLPAITELRLRAGTTETVHLNELPAAPGAVGRNE
ncbi:MAG: carboxypeptidase-like regulatory domain-containing protein [Acidobacteriota bacterium]